MWQSRARFWVRGLPIPRQAPTIAIKPGTHAALALVQTGARTGSFAAAARELGLVPSALTYRIRQVEDARRLLLAGADKISVNTAAVENRDLISACADAFGSRTIRGRVESFAL